MTPTVTDPRFSSILIYQPAGTRKEAWSRLRKETAGKDAPFAQNIGKKDKGGTKEGS